MPNNSQQIARDIQATLLRYKAGMISLSQARQELAFYEALIKAWELSDIEARLERLEAGRQNGKTGKFCAVRHRSQAREAGSPTGAEAMISRQEVKRMIAQGLTGQEAGRLVLLDSVEVDHGRPGILTAKELERIKRSLLPEEASVYNALVYAYQLIGYSLLEAHGQYLEARLNLESVSSPLTLYALEAFLQEARKWYPLIWTEKQLQEQGPPPDGRPVAIIQQPAPDLLDDQGYYALPEPLSDEMIKSLTLVKMIEEKLAREGDIGYLEALLIFSRRAREHIKALKAYHQVLEELGSLLDVPLTEDFGPWWRGLEVAVDAYNRAFTLHGTGWIKLTVEGDKGERLSQIRLSMLKADPETLAYMRDRMAMALGEDWWKEAGHGR